LDLKDVVGYHAAFGIGRIEILTKHAICLFFVASGVLDHFGLRESQVQGSLNLVGNPEKLRLSLSILTLN
jgi:hypothetical protein